MNYLIRFLLFLLASNPLIAEKALHAPPSSKAPKKKTSQLKKKKKQNLEKSADQDTTEATSNTAKKEEDFCAPANTQQQNNSTKLPLPRFAALRSKKVNLHLGPGQNYPCDYQYQRQYLPVEIIAEFDLWRKIRDFNKHEGWIHKGLLTGRRYCLLETPSSERSKTITLYSAPSAESSLTARAEKGVIGRLLECNKHWCFIEIKTPDVTVKGWAKRLFLFGIYPSETHFKR